MRALVPWVSLAGIILSSMLLPVAARSATPIRSDSRLYINTSGEFEKHLSDAIERRHVALTLTNNRATADYVIESDAVQDVTKVLDRHTGDVVFIWSAGGKPASPRRRADACARQLARSIQMPPRHKSVAKDPVWEFQ